MQAEAELEVVHASVEVQSTERNEPEARSICWPADLIADDF